MRSAIVRRTHNDSLDDDSPEEALEQGTLAFTSLSKDLQTESDTWQKPCRLKISGDGSRILRFDIISARAIPSSELHKRHVKYTLSVRQDSNVIDPSPAEIERRYTHFLQLYEGLRKEYPNLLTSVSFPKKVLLGNFGADLLSHRSTGFESLLEVVSGDLKLRETKPLLQFLLGDEWAESKVHMEEGRPDLAVPILENKFRLLNKIYMDRSRPVLVTLLHLFVACIFPGTLHPQAEHWAELALHRFEAVSDTDLLVLYVPLLQACVHLWWQKGRDKQVLDDRLKEMARTGVKIEGCLPLSDALKKFDETILV